MTNYRCVNFYDLCRVCTASSDQKINVFSAEGRSKNLIAKIAECLSLTIEEKDRLPKVLCVQCLQHVESIVEFRLICKNSQEMLLSCLNTATLQNGGKVLIKDAITGNGKSLSVLNGTNALTNNNNNNGNILNIGNIIPSLTPLSNTLPANSTSATTTMNAPNMVNTTLQSTDILNSIMQAVGIQPQQYTITLDPKLLKDETITTTPTTTRNAQEYTEAEEDKTDRDSKQNALEEFLKMKPNLKVTAIKKQKKPVPVQPQQTVSQQQQQQNELVIEHQQQQQKHQDQMQQQNQLQHQQQQQLSQLQMQQLQHQIQQQIQQQWTQHQLQQQIQQLAAQLQLQQQQHITISAPTTSNSITNTPTINTFASDDISPSKNKKPKLNFVLSSTSATLPQLTQPQIQLQIQPSQHQQQQQTAATILSNLAPLLQQQPQNLLTSNTTTMLSPNKCFLPITIKDENSDQQIVAHIDAKNFVMPTTYQLQMKLQPQIETVNGQPIMQLTPTSIPATIQLTPNNTTFQTVNTLQPQMLQQQQQQTSASTQQFHLQQQQQPQQQQKCASTVQITSQQIIKSSSSIKNYETTNESNKSNPQQTMHTKPNEIKATTNFAQQILEQVQHQHKQQQATTVSAITGTNGSGLTVQRISKLPKTSSKSLSATIATKTATTTEPPSTLPPKIPLLNVNNVTISRVTNTTKQQHQNQAKDQMNNTNRPNQQQQQPTQHAAPTTTATTTRLLSPVKKIVNKVLTTKPTTATKPTITTTVAEKPTITGSQTKLPTLNDVGGKGKSEKSATPLDTSDATIATILPSKSSPASTVIKCDQCGRNFKKKEHLTQHVKLHAGIRPFKCTQTGCEKTFSRKEHLLRHLISHSGKKLFSCDLCNKPFSRKDNLNKHRRIHSTQTNDPNYKCEICNKTYAVKSYYQQHKQTHNKEKKDITNKSTTKTQQENKSIQEQQQQHQPQQIQILQYTSTPNQQQQQSIMHMQTGGTITITPTNNVNNTNQQTSGGGVKSLNNLVENNANTNHDSTVLNLPVSLANFVQLTPTQYVNTSTYRK